MSGKLNYEKPRLVDLGGSGWACAEGLHVFSGRHFDAPDRRLGCIPGVSGPPVCSHGPCVLRTPSRPDKQAGRSLRQQQRRDRDGV